MSAYSYGRLLGSLRRGLEEMNKQIAAGFADAYNRKPLPERTAEELSELRYQQRIEAERKAGLRYVRARTDRLRRDLGLRAGR